MSFRYRAEADRQAIPAIDRYHGQRQVDQLFVGKVLARFFIDIIGHVINGNKRHGLRPCQRGPFALGKKGRLSPGNKGIKALFGFAARPRGFRMQVDSIRAPVDLRCANLDEFDK